MAYENLRSPKMRSPKRRDGYFATQADYDNILVALERLYAVFPDCEGGEAGKACQLARLAIASANEGTTDNDICGFCGLPGADKIPHPICWPGEDSAGTELVHAECEDAECQRANSLLSDKQRDDFLRNI